MVDKYGTGQDPYCYPGTTVLRNCLGLLDDNVLNEAERSLSEIAVSEIDFSPPPYDLRALQCIHRQLFGELYDRAGESRSVDISKGSTHFCHVTRVEAEANKNAGYEISWWPVEEGEWLSANIDAVFCDYGALVRIFDRCIGQPIE
ncbi:cell filamentation protein Fic [Pseudomonas sp. MOB-449]|nr:cell filamentation protein Fic [Pseudomonas sp. MOB-449]